MQKRYRDLLRVVVTDLRHTLSGGPNSQRGDLDRELERLGVAPDGTITPFDALPNPTPAERQARRATEAMMNERVSGGANGRSVRSDIVERAAYTWINRLLALRAMEARGLIAELLRADPAYAGLSEALFVLRQTQAARAAGPDGGWWAVLEGACQAQAVSLPGLFDLADAAAALRPSTPALLRCVTTIGTPPTGYTAEEADAAFADPDAIGWAYQFYQEEAKARTYAKLNSGGKAATRGEIAAVTQLFTEPYMVKWLLQNSLGRTYHELYPDSRLPDTWEYYIRDLPRDESVDNPPSVISGLEDLTFMDPCMGSGHFEREAFDMYFAMYREQYPDMRAAEIADRILTRHLHGIDLDPRAAQLAALTLYLRAWELVRDERRAQRLPGPGTYHPPTMNLATTPTGLTPGSLARHLQRHPEDRIYRPLLDGIFAALEQADVLGSLLRPGEQLDAAIKKFRAQGSGQLGLLAEDDDLNRLLGELARHDPAELKRVLLERVARSIAAEAGDADDVAMALFGREAGEGLRLLQLLSSRYSVAATNPPYMGGSNMGGDLARYVDHNYESGKNDLYAVFMLRCVELCRENGRVAVVVPETWMFLRAFTSLRTLSNGEGRESNTKRGLAGLLQSTRIEAIVHLGRHAFTEGDPPANPAMLNLSKMLPEHHRLWACRLTASRPSELQANLLRRAVQINGQAENVSTPKQESFLRIPEAPIAYWLSGSLTTILASGERVRDVAAVHDGMTTGDNLRFLRLFWEVNREQTGWVKYAKAGRYCKWFGLEQYLVRWNGDGARIKDHPRSYVRNEARFFTPGITYSLVARGSMNARVLENSAFDPASISIFSGVKETDLSLLAILNNHVSSYLLRIVTGGGTKFNGGYVATHPIPRDAATEIRSVVEAAVALKRSLLAFDPVELGFLEIARDDSLETLALLLTVEGVVDAWAVSAYGISDANRNAIAEETGTPAGAYPLASGYDSLFTAASVAFAPTLLEQVNGCLRFHPRIKLERTEMAEVVRRLRAFYEAGPGDMESGSSGDAPDDVDEQESELVTHRAIPSESFLEQLSQAMQLHPITVYWLIRSLQAEGARCKPEELRLLEDRLSVLILRLLGHRWPRQLEAGEAVPSWADRDGIIPLTAIAGETRLAAHVRDRLRAEDGDRGAQQVEALLLELTKQTLEEWLRRTFFVRHVRQFKHRPIAWHLASTPAREAGRKTKTKRVPAFECLLYYHACRGDVLARLRAHYVAPLIRLETAAAAEARRRGDETAAAIATARVHELEEFAGRLRTVEELGFASAELDHLLAGEPLDRWSGDGILPPASAEDLVAQERAWQVDINDGVRVNVAPLQLAGLLISDVLRPDDARKAIADRARWRSDERRWVREGVLPRCGWMEDDVPESPRWTERAPERAAEQRKLEEKRRAVMERTSAAQGKEV